MAKADLRSKSFTPFTPFAIFFLICCAYAIWSYALTGANLVLSQNELFWQFQTYMWSLDPHLKTQVYVVLVVAMFGAGLWCAWTCSKKNWPVTLILQLAMASSLPLLLSNNALSHDVFNYIFNARMVLKYHVDPHIKVALDFSFDPWIRFMHNVHTSAPYFYGWTGLSLIPYALGFGKFTLTWFLFRLFNAVAWGLTLLGLSSLVKTAAEKKWLAVLCFLPLPIIELISNAHNDSWMMALGVGSIALLSKKRSPVFVILSLGLLLLSMSQKYVTVLLAPIWLWVLVRPWIESNLPKWKLTFSIYDLAAFLLFIPLLTDRSQWFHPWYLVWPLAFLPIMKNRFLQLALVTLSISSLMRYVPWMWNGAFDYSDWIIVMERRITWVPLIVFGALYLLNLVHRYVSGKMVQ